MRIVLRVVAVLVVVAGVGSACLETRPTTSKLCTTAGSIDEVGGPTPEAARDRWAEEVDLDLGEPDRIGGSGGTETATYPMDGPTYGPVDPDRTYFREVVTERRAGDAWFVVSANTCASWET